MDGLRRRVRHGCLPSRGACPDRGAAASEARAQTACPITAIPQPDKEQKNGRGQCPRPLVLPAVGVLAGGIRASRRPAPCFRAFVPGRSRRARSEEHTSELQSLMRISYAVFCLKKKTQTESTY